MKALDRIRNAPPSIIAILIGLVRSTAPTNAPADQQHDVGGFAIQQPSPNTTLLPAARNASTSFYDLLISSYASPGMPASGVQGVTTPAMDGASKETTY